MELIKEKELADKIMRTFADAKVNVQREKRVIVELPNDMVHPFLSYAKESLGFVHLSHISCVDWIEENKFELVFIILSYETLITVLVKTKIDREKAEFPTLLGYWPQVETYEREIREMYGVNFIGNDDKRDLILEDWDNIPPMRKDFDTVKYSRETFFMREGREDAKDVRETISEHSGEEIPDLAKIYSVRNT
jgi:NADH-quinone oxidoreductase subunit C